jgi:hypothetical protein
MQLEETRLPLQGSGNFAAGTDFLEPLAGPNSSI